MNLQKPKASYNRLIYLRLRGLFTRTEYEITLRTRCKK